MNHDTKYRRQTIEHAKQGKALTCSQTALGSIVCLFYFGDNMNTDIRLSVDFFSHHKTKKMARVLGADGLVCLVKLFCYVGKFRPDGNLKGMDTFDIAGAVDWGGDQEAFVSTLCEVGFLEMCDDGFYTVHDWEQHNPWAAGAKERSLAASKAGKASAEKRLKSTSISTDVQRISTDGQRAVEKGSERISTEGQPQNGNPTPSPSPSPLPTPIVKNKSVVTASKEKRFTPPTVEEVSAYCLERKNNIDPQYWWDSYQAKNWMVGKNKMSDWKAAVRTWESNGVNGKSKPVKPVSAINQDFSKKDYGKGGLL